MSGPARNVTEGQMHALASAIGQIASVDGDHQTAIPALTLYRRSQPTDPLHCIYNVGLGIVAQGEKHVLVGRDSWNYGPGKSMLTSIDLPVVSHVTRASVTRPFLGLMLTFDVRSLALMASQLGTARLPRNDASRSISFQALEHDLLDALIRLLKSLQETALVSTLAPLIQQEIIARLLTGPHGAHLRRLATSGSPSQQIAESVAWLKQNFVQALAGEDLADRAHMSPSTFRQHFRALTGVSPLQYQKQLRLQEARQLMLNENLDARSAAIHVGYESASQFSREYSRMYGAPPQRDVARLRVAPFPPPTDVQRTTSRFGDRHTSARDRSTNAPPAPL